MVRKRVFGALSALVLVGSSGCGNGEAGSGASDSDSDALTVGIIPNISPEEQEARYEPFGEYLEETLGRDVELFVAVDYAGVVAALAGERVDIAYLGGLTYLQANEQVDLRPLVTEVDQETGTSEYYSSIVVSDDSPLESAEDVIEAGGGFAFGDVSSTSGSLYPRIMLVEAGAECDPERIDQCAPFDEVIFTGGHDAAAQAVLSGSVDAAGVERRILRRLEDEGSIPEGELRIVEELLVPGYPWVMRTELGDELRTALIETFTAIEEPDLLDLMRADGFVEVTPEDYTEMRTHTEELGLLTIEG